MFVAYLYRAGYAVFCIAIASKVALAAPAAAGAHNHDHSQGHAAHGHDGHHLCEHDIVMPKDYASAVARIKKCRATIGEETAEGHLDEVHAPLDEATIILSKLMTLARDSGVPKSQWQEINVAARDLKKRLTDLHTAIETKRKVDFKAASVPIDQAIRRLDLTARAPSDVLTR
jgi:hypothetical protein